MAREVPVGEVQAEDIHPCRDELVQFFGIGRGRPQGGHDFSAPPVELDVGGVDGHGGWNS